MFKRVPAASVALAAWLMWLAGPPAVLGQGQSDSLSAQERIEEALRQPASLDMADTPLSDLVETLKEKHQINVVLDVRALDEFGIASDTPISFSISGVSLESALSLVLRGLDLTWAIHDEVLLITTPEEAELMLLTKVYEVSDLVICRNASGELWADFDTLIEMITVTIAPDTWDDVGGPGSIAPASLRGGDVLVIAQTYQVHRKIAKLLEDLQGLVEKAGKDTEPPLREKRLPEPLGYVPSVHPPVDPAHWHTPIGGPADQPAADEAKP